MLYPEKPFLFGVKLPLPRKDTPRKEKTASGYNPHTPKGEVFSGYKSRYPEGVSLFGVQLSFKVQRDLSPFGFQRDQTLYPLRKDLYGEKRIPGEKSPYRGIGVRCTPIPRKDLYPVRKDYRQVYRSFQKGFLSVVFSIGEKRIPGDFSYLFKVDFFVRDYEKIREKSPLSKRYETFR